MKSNFIQILRFFIQLYFIVGLIFAIGLFPDEVGQWLFYSIIIFGVFFCGWICPFGTTQEWLFTICKKLHIKQFKIPYKYQKFLFILRYIFWILNFWGITFSLLQLKMEFNSSMWAMLNISSQIFIIIFLIGSLFTERPFCNYFCIYGATYSIASILKIFGVKRNDNACSHCKICNKTCPMNINIENVKFVRNPNCINCFKCIKNCPKHCLSYNFCFYKNKNLK